MACLSLDSTGASLLEGSEVLFLEYLGSSSWSTLDPHLGVPGAPYLGVPGAPYLGVPGAPYLGEKERLECLGRCRGGFTGGCRGTCREICCETWRGMGSTLCWFGGVVRVLME